MVLCKSAAAASFDMKAEAPASFIASTRGVDVTFLGKGYSLLAWIYVESWKGLEG